MDMHSFDIVWIDACTYSAQGGVQKHKHDFFHFLYVDSGTGVITIAERNYTMYPGTLYLVPPFVDHAFFNNANTPLKTLEIKFRLQDANAEGVIEEMPYCMNVSGQPIKSVLLTILKEKSKRITMSEELVCLHFRLLFLYLLRCHESLQSDELYDNQKVPAKTFLEINRVITYIRENLTAELSLEKLAKLSGFEKNYFLKKFKKQTKQTPMAYVRDVRIKKAKELLRYSDMNVSQIALATGFASVHYFSNVFLRCTGKRPLAYRNENKPK